MSLDMSALTVLAMAAPAEGQQGFSLLGLLPFIGMFAIFYFLLIAPTRKKQKAHAEMIRSLKNGDQIVTSGGIRGTVVGLADEYVQVRVADQVKIEIMRSHVSDVSTKE